MAVNPKTQLLKLALGTLTVIAITGATGWIYQAQTNADAGQTARQDPAGDATLPRFRQEGAQVQPPADQPATQGGGATSGEGGQGRQGGGFRLGQSGSTSGTAPAMRTRSRHS